MAKKAFVDIETTGVEPNNCGVVQIAMIIEIDDVVEEALNLKCRPFGGDEIMQSALDIIRKTEEELNEYQEPVSIHKALLDIMDKYVNRYDPRDKFWFIGYNSHFDDQFLRKWFSKCGDKYYGSWFWWPPLDVAQFAAEYLQNERADMPNFKLATVAKHFGLKHDEAEMHDATADVVLTRDIYHHLFT